MKDKLEYKKEPITFTAQVELLEQRGLTIHDKPKAEFYLKNISFFRLSSYTFPFQKAKHVFLEDTNFEDVIDLYKFDRELRLLLLDEIERIEVSIRTQINYCQAHKYGSHWIDNSSLFNIKKTKDKTGLESEFNIYSITKNIIISHCEGDFPELYISHYISKYDRPPVPPCWMILELLTMGEMSRLFAGIKTPQDKKDIAAYYGLHHSIFENWIHALTYLRNVCAHHSRLWNRDFVIQPEIPKKTLTNPWLSVENWNFIENKLNSKCFFLICIIKYFLNTINPNSHFKDRLSELFEKYPNIPLDQFGIPLDKDGNIINWKNEPLWK